MRLAGSTLESLVGLIPSPALGQTAPRDVLAVVERLFDRMRARDRVSWTNGPATRWCQSEGCG